MEKLHICSTNLIDDVKREKVMSLDMSDFADHLMSERFRSLANIAKGPVSCWLPDTTLTFVNAAYCELLGKDAHEILGERWVKMMPEQLRDQADDIYSRLAKNPTLHRFEYGIRRKNQMCYVEWVDHPVFNEKGQVVEFLSIGRDVTEQKKNKQDLIESESRYMHLVESMHEGVIMQNEIGIIVHVNDSFLRIINCHRNDLIGRSVYELFSVHEEIVDILTKQAQQGITAYRHVQDLILERSIGKKTYVQVFTVPIIQENIFKGGYMILTDISRQKRVEERLRKINECLSYLGNSFFHNIGDLVQLCGEIMEGSWVTYHCVVEDERLNLRGKWKVPGEYVEDHLSLRHMCYDVMRNNNEHPLILRNLAKSAYADVDPCIKKYDFSTYIGLSVRINGNCIGVLSIYYKGDFTPVKDDIKALGIVAAAISSEEVRRDSQKILEKKMVLQNVIARISSRFVGKFDFDQAVQQSLADIGVMGNSDRVYVFLIQNEKFITNTHEWCAEGVESQIRSLQKLPIENFAWWMNKLHRGETIFIKDVRQLPESARAEKIELMRQGTTSLVAFPIYMNGVLTGFLGCDNVVHIAQWQDGDLVFLRIVAEIFGNALDLLRADKETHKTLEKLQHAKKEWEITVDALPQVICLLDNRSKIVRVNDTILSWGYKSIRDIRGKTIHDIFHKKCHKNNCKLQSDISHIWNNVIDGKSAEVIYSSDLMKKKLCIKFHPVTKEMGAHKCFAIAVIYDITEKMQANRQIFDMFKYLGVINRRVSILLNMGRDGIKREKHEAYEFIVKSSKLLAHAAISALYISDTSQRKYLLVACDYDDMGNKSAFPKIIEADEYNFVKKMLRTHERVQETVDDSLFSSFADMCQLKSTISICLALPLVYQNYFYGFLFVGFNEKNDPSTQELEFYDLFSLQTSLIIMNLEQRDVQ